MEREGERAPGATTNAASGSPAMNHGYAKPEVKTRTPTSNWHWDVWRERVVYALLFLLPIAGVSVRHWISTTFAILILLSLPDLFRARPRLARPERRLFVIVVLFFGVFVFTSVINGWTEEQIHFLGRELRLLFLIPVYLMMRRYPNAGLWLLRGGLIGGFALLAQALYDVKVLGMSRAQGIYSPNLLGPIAALVAISLLVLWRIERDRKWVGYVVVGSIAAAVGAVAYSGSRGAYVGLLGMLFVGAAISFRRAYFAAAVVCVVGLALIGYFASDHVRWRVDVGAAELRSVIESGGSDRSNAYLGSVAARLELWRASFLVFRDNPISGVGRGNYVEATRKYVEQGEVHPDVLHYNHPHNAYLEMLVSKGILGLLAFLTLLFYPLAYFVRTRHVSRETAALGAGLVAGFALFSLTDASTFIKGNFISVFAIYLAAAFSWHVRMLRAQKA